MPIIKSLHADYIWPVILVVALVYAVALVRGLLQKGSYGTFQRIGGLSLLILMDLQLLAGLILYGVQQRWTGTDVLRSYEHPFQMIVAIVVFHVGYRQIKLASDSQAKLRAGLIWMSVSILIVGIGLARIKGLMGT